jgi:sulfite reductase alpha subunit-like flavoprotein
MSLFVSSTFGNGDPPTSAKIFAHHLKNAVEGDIKELPYVKQTFNSCMIDYNTLIFF